MKKPDPPRGMLKPTLKWPGQNPTASESLPRGGAASLPQAQRRLEGKVDPKAQAQKKAGLGSNSVTQSQFSLEQLKQMAASRGIPVEKLIAQMVQQYLKEDTTEE